MAEWLLHSYRVVWFGGGTESIGAGELFSTAFGDEAETVQKNRVPGVTNPFWSKASGRSGANTLVEVQVQPGRIDVVFAPPPDQSPETSTLRIDKSVITDIATTLANAGQAARVAIVVEAILPQPDYQTALFTSQSHAGLENLVPGVHDFSLQMNRRRKFKCDDAQEMNFVARWGTAISQLIQIDFGSGQVQPSPVTHLQHAASVLLDINSVPTGASIETGQQITMYLEMDEVAQSFLREPTLQRLL